MNQMADETLDDSAELTNTNICVDIGTIASQRGLNHRLLLIKIEIKLLFAVGQYFQ